MLLFDGSCALCSASVRFILERERAPVLRFAPLAGTTAAAVRQAHPAIAGIDSLILVEGAEVRVRSAAALRLAGYLRRPWPLLRMAWIIPRPLRDAVYDRIARHRHRVAGAGRVVPPAEAAARFLD